MSTEIYANIIIGVFFLLCAAGVFWLLVLHSRAKKLEKELAKNEEIEPAKPITKSILTSVTVLNNRTGDKEVVTSANKFGLALVFPDDPEIIVVRQLEGFNYKELPKDDEKHCDWSMIRRYYDFSLVNTEFIETVINQEELDAKSINQPTAA